ncbi:MAG: hypothetical protein H0X38_02240 [Planctomycetes bacterium]|nr:hypothetical protein [Planctomycetota bacterium]
MKVFLPWFGHFGDLVRDVLPWIWAHWQPGDVIGGDPRQALLYPVPPEPVLWAPVAAQYPHGYDSHIRPGELPDALRRVALARWPRAVLRQWSRTGEVFPKPSLRLPDPVAIDVVLAPRRKPYADAKNGWPWEALAQGCQARGWTVGLAGTREESASVPHAIAAWDIAPADGGLCGTIALLRGARAVVTLDSGIGHLASLVDAPQLVVYPRRGDERRSLVLRDGRHAQMRFADMHRWNTRLCLPVWGGVDAVLTALIEVMTRTQIALGPIAPWRAHHVSRVPGWEAGQTIVVKETERSLIMRPEGNVLIETSPLPPARPAIPVHERERRRATCRACAHYRAGSDRCAVCGCGFVIAERIVSRVARCPGGFW